jgi:hypothetical protein
MRKILLAILLSVVFYSCENTEEPQTDYYKMIGSVDFKLQRVLESGRVLGTFNCSYYLANTKVELLYNEKIVETTYTIPDTTIDILFLLEKLELNTQYKIRVELNSEMSVTSDEFMITEDEIRYLPDSLTSELTEQFSWFKPGKYYWDYNFNKEKNLTFDLYTDTEKLVVYPNPVLNMGIIEIMVESEDTVSLDLLDLKLNNKVTFYNNEILSPGNHSFAFNTEDIENGLYIIRFSVGGMVYYCPVLIGLKGAPAQPG